MVIKINFFMLLFICILHQRKIPVFSIQQRFNFAQKKIGYVSGVLREIYLMNFKHASIFVACLPLLLHISSR